MTGGPTYRELIDRADRDVARAAIELATAPLNSRRAAREAVAAYRALLGAIHAHLKALTIHCDRVADLAATSLGDPRDLAVMQIVRGLIGFAYLPGRLRYETEGPATTWGAAKTSLDAATDLLTTYRNQDGVICAPEALQLQDPAYRATALAGIGDLASTVLGAERELAQWAAESGMTHEDLARLLPDLRPLHRSLLDITGLGHMGRNETTILARRSAWTGLVGTKMDPLPSLDREGSMSPRAPGSFVTAAGPAVLEVPVACTLGAADQPGRLAAWTDLLAGVQHRESIDGGLRLVFGPDPEFAARLADLAMREQQCCSFFTFTLRLTGQAVELDVTAPPDAAEVVADLFGTPA